MICNSRLSKKVGNAPIHSRLKIFIFYFVRIFSEVPGIAYFPVAINHRIDKRVIVMKSNKCISQMSLGFIVLKSNKLDLSLAAIHGATMGRKRSTTSGKVFSVKFKVRIKGRHFSFRQIVVKLSIVPQICIKI